MPAGFAAAPAAALFAGTRAGPALSARSPRQRGGRVAASRVRLAASAGVGGGGGGGEVAVGEVHFARAAPGADDGGGAAAAAAALWAEFSWAPDEADDAHDTECVVARDGGGAAVGAGRAVRAGVNVEISRLCVVDAYRGRGVGRGLVEQLMKAAAPIEGALHVEATHGELGFFSLLGFEAQGPAYAHGRTGEWHRHMVYKFPACAPASDCVGLHHTAIRVLDIERSLAWYGCVGFIVSEKFYTPGGCRACFVEGLGVRIELVESTTGAGVSGVQDWPGFLVFDVTRGCRDLDSFLAHLRKRNGGMLTVTGEPAHQVIGSKLLSVATVEDPDGLPIDFIRREGHLSQTLLRRVDW